MTTLNTALKNFFATNAANAASIVALAAVCKAEKIKSADALRPYAMAQASKHYDVAIITKTTGSEVFDSEAKNYEACRKACNRALSKVFPSAKDENNQTDPVAPLVAKFAKLSAAQKRRFLKAVAE